MLRRRTARSPGHCEISVTTSIASAVNRNVVGRMYRSNWNRSLENELMKTAQQQAAELFEKNDERYEKQARDAIERQLHAIAKLFDGTLDIRWRESATREQPRLVMDESLKTGPAKVAH